MEQLKKLGRFKYPLLVLLFGLLLMLLPQGGGRETAEESVAVRLEQALGCTEGVGRVRVIVSDNGAVIVCDGAGKAAVRLDILHAVASCTGFGADKITVLKMS